MYTNEEFLIELLLESGMLNKADFEGVRHRKKADETMLEALIRMGKVGEEDVARTVAINAGMDYVDLNRAELDPAAQEVVDSETAIRYKIIPIGFHGAGIYIAVGDPLDFDALDSVRHVLSYEPEFLCAPQSQIKELLTSIYGATFGTEVTTREVAGGGESNTAEVGDAPIIKLVYQILQEAYQNRASDIHIEPLETEIRVRYRIDGALHKVATHPLRLHSAIIARIKIMSGTMSIAEKRLPQDGRIQATVGDKDLDLRVSTVPTNGGESVVMRILDKSSLSLGLPQLGFFTDDQQIFHELIRLPDGILLVTGPTGSGKTTTLYACLNEINKPDRKIITVEDPVEYLLSGINQVQVKEDIGMSFAAALRAILRQAPNIIMIGEIRDKETASIAINASLTGHLVFSTLHTNDAPGAVARLADIGIKRFLIASAVRAIMAQRLVRGVCQECKTPTRITEKEMRMLRLDERQIEGASIMTGAGCRACRNTGFRGRIGIFEIFRITEEVSQMINKEMSTPQLRKRARELGMRTLREDGVRKVLNGRTSAAEVVRVTMADSD
ncbi:MAG TPA: GspE/PulE family protein [Verrucomicrobiales bacterium]|nr:type II/IV secretion system protein [Verrucomicrobiae bacterium]MCC6881576.1 type II/IV secretion system protein [Verrucomicrobiales bacterium]MCP5553213.1 type II/IV secretion system protein [Akkermansiaceae bacterium]HRX53782.1 GspE/PulE family protein [Verrucomicrobiales bacterium]